MSVSDDIVANRVRLVAQTLEDKGWRPDHIFAAPGGALIRGMPMRGKRCVIFIREDGYTLAATKDHDVEYVEGMFQEEGDWVGRIELHADTSCCVYSKRSGLWVDIQGEHSFVSVQGDSTPAPESDSSEPAGTTLEELRAKLRRGV